MSARLPNWQTAGMLSTVIADEINGYLCSRDAEDGQEYAVIRNIVQKHLELNRPRVVHLTIRDPDYENEHYEDVSGLVEVQTIDIDLSGPFNGPKNFWVDMSEDDAREWLENHRTEVAHLPADSPVRKRVETLCADLEAGHP